MKVATIAGVERCDFVYHLGRILSSISSTVIVIDNSKDKELYLSVQQPLYEKDKDVYVAKRSDIVYLKDVAYSPEFFEAFEYVLIYDGILPELTDIEKSDYTVILPDYRPATLQHFKNMPENVEFIMRDRAGKVNERAVALTMGVKPNQIIGALDYDDRDYAAYLSLLYNGRQKLIGISGEYIIALTYVISKIMGINMKEASKIVKKVRH